MFSLGSVMVATLCSEAVLPTKAHWDGLRYVCLFVSTVCWEAPVNFPPIARQSLLPLPKEHKNSWLWAHL